MKISRYLTGDSKIVLAKFHQNRLRIDREIDEKHAIKVNLTVGISSLLSSGFVQQLNLPAVQ